MNRIIFLLEERSIKILLDSLIPRLIPGLSFLCIPHEGKQDLEKSFPRKLRAWRKPNDRFVIIIDNDGADCYALKRRLKDICSSNSNVDVLIRVVCQELESWYLGDPAAMAVAFGKPHLKALGRKPRFRDPDSIHQPSKEIVRLVPEFQKISGARALATHLTRSGNRSRSFQVTMDGIERLFSAIRTDDSSSNDLEKILV